jgi:hypothetical protein
MKQIARPCRKASEASIDKISRVLPVATHVAAAEPVSPGALARLLDSGV